MSLSLSPETEALIRDEMKRRGFANADDAVRLAFETLNQAESEALDESETAELRASIEQMKRGEGVDWKDLSAAARARHLNP
jgi:Arc/MetJ-type ribon-helix-helix transcriptional regulator